MSKEIVIQEHKDIEIPLKAMSFQGFRFKKVHKNSLVLGKHFIYRKMMADIMITNDLGLEDQNFMLLDESVSRHASITISLGRMSIEGLPEVYALGIAGFQDIYFDTYADARQVKEKIEAWQVS